MNTIQANDAWLEVIAGVTYRYFKTDKQYPFSVPVINFEEFEMIATFAF